MTATFRLAVLQRVCTPYRVGLFQRLGNQPDYRLRLFVGDDVRGTKVRNTEDFGDLDVVRLPTRQWKLGSRVLVYHPTLWQQLDEYRPDVILCEGESNALNAIQAIAYRFPHPRVGLTHWSLGGLPGVQDRKFELRNVLRRGFRKAFDSFVAYSSYGREVLMREGVRPDSIFVATNVADTTEQLRRAAELACTCSEARARLSLPDRFTVIYVGAMDHNKRLEVLLDTAAHLDANKFTFLLVGSGEFLDALRSSAAARGLQHVYFPGRVTTDLPLYFRASNVLVLPGRGGMVISEALAHALPVVVHQADGTEFDLVQDGVTGIRLKNGDVEEFRHAILRLREDPELERRMGVRGQALVWERFTPENMVGQIVAAVECARKRRRQLNGVQ